MPGVMMDSINVVHDEQYGRMRFVVRHGRDQRLYLPFSAAGAKAAAAVVQAQMMAAVAWAEEKRESDA